MVRIDLIDGCQHILRAGIHGLSAFYNIVHAQFPEYGVHSFPDRHGNESDGFARFLRRFLLLFLLCRFCLLRSHLFRVADQLLLMFLPHIVYLHPR